MDAFAQGKVGVSRDTLQQRRDVLAKSLASNVANISTSYTKKNISIRIGNGKIIVDNLLKVPRHIEVTTSEYFERLTSSETAGCLLTL